MLAFNAGSLNRVVLKISGEFLAGKRGFGYDPEVISNLVEDIIEARKLGLSLAVILGGGNMFRGGTASENGLDRVTADNVGMLATIQNALVICDALKRRNVMADVYSAVQMDKIAPFYTPAKALSSLDKGKICFICGGTGNPFFTTDTAAILRAVELNANLVLKGTKVDGVFTADPAKNPDAEFIADISYDEVLQKKLRVMDMTAFSLARDNSVKLKVFNVTVKGMLAKAILEPEVGTYIHK